MPLQKQTLDIPLGGGMQDKVDPKLVEPPALLDAVNCRYDKAGRVAKRHGHTLVDAANAPGGTAHTLFDLDGALHLVSTVGFARYNATEQRYREPLSLTGSGSNGEPHPLFPLQVSAGRVIRSTETVHLADNQVSGSTGLICYAWAESAKLYARVDEVTTGVTIVGPVELTSAAALYFDLRVAAAGDTLIVFAHDGVATLYEWHCDTTQNPMSFTAAANISVASPNYPFDVFTDAQNQVARLASFETANGTRFRSFDSSLTATTNVAVAAIQADTKLAITMHVADGEVWTASNDAAAPTVVELTRLDASYVVQAGPNTSFIRLGAAFNRLNLVESATTQRVWLASEETRNAGVREHLTRVAQFADTGAAQTQVVIGYHLRLIGKGILRLSEPFWLLAYEAPPEAAGAPSGVTRPPQPRAFLAKPYSYVLGGAQAFWGAHALALLDREQSGAGGARVLGHLAPISASTYRVAAIVEGATDDQDGVDFVDFRFPGDPLPVEFHSGDALLGAGILYSYDGERVSELSPNQFPEGPEIDTGAVGAGNVDVGVHRWRLVWEWEDRQGNVHRSAPSRPTERNVSGSPESIPMTYPDLTLRAQDGVHAQNVKIGLYRTLAGGSVYHLVKRETPVADTVLGMNRITDNVADSVVSTQEFLYTEGGIVQNDTPPPMFDLAATKQRIFGVNAEDRAEVWYSKLLQQTVAPEFSGAFKLRVPRGKVVALAPLDDRLIAFTESEVYALHGDGPLDTGQQDSFSRFLLVSGDMGCENRGSVVAGPFGVAFQSQAGIHVLRRDLQIQFIGAAVEDQTAGKVVTSAIHVPGQKEVRFHTRGGSEVLSWNYLFDAWSRWDGLAVDHMALFGDLAVYARDTEDLWFEDSTVFLDATGYYSQTVVTPWLKPASKQGFVRVWRALFLGEFEGVHDLRIRVGYDYLDTYGTTYTIDEAVIATVTASWPYQFGIHVEQQKLQAIRFELTDLTPTGGTTGEGFSVAQVTLLAGVKRGARRLPQTAEV